jgi:SsrA-binding protein
MTNFVVLLPLFILLNVPISQSFIVSSIIYPNIVNYAWQSSSAKFAKSGKKKKKPKDNTIAVNRQAYRNYEILETMEAGISLLGTEVKSIRDGKMNLRDGFVKANPDGRGCTLLNVHISKHRFSGEYFQHEERRPRPLLVHKQQARKLKLQTEADGMTVVPLRAYFNPDNRVKLQIALCRGKNVRDKRQTIKEREAKRETSRMMKSFRIG